MAFEVATAYVRILPSLLGFGAVLARQLRGESGAAGAASRKLGLYMGAGIAAGIAATIGIGLKDEVEHQKIAAQTTAAITSTGGAANVTKDHVESLAESLRKLSGIDDDVIQSGENMLLTFTNIKNVAGEGNDIFDQSTRILTDMSTALGTDAKTQAIQLGKALNDPIKGITALTRVGVTFNKEQKDTITKLQESGDTLGAQKVILKELNKEFGGSAEAYGKTIPGALGRAKYAYQDLAGTLARMVLPALTSLAEGFASFVEFMDRHTTLFHLIVAGLGLLATGMITYSVATKIASAANILFGISFEALLGPITLVVTALIALGVGFVILWKKSKTFQAIVTGVFNAIKTVVMAVVGFVIDHWKLLFPQLALIVGVIKKIIEHFQTIKSVGKAVFDAVTTAIHTVGDALQPIISFLDTILDKISKIHIPGSGILSHIPGLASGGPVTAGKTYLVGEEGPELFVSGRSGRIIPNDMLGAAAGGGYAIVDLDNARVFIRREANSEVSGAAAHNAQLRRMRR